jgi:antitoxin (DNA-binding transcriptional repressor) of toxin-antitoxin stability system
VCSTLRYTSAVRHITQRELRNESGQIMRALEAGESFLVTRGGTPVGELIPLRRRGSARLATVLEIFRGAPRVNYARLRKDLDAIADPDPRPRA